MNEFMDAIIKMAREVAKEYHGFVEEEGFLFSPSTVSLVEEIEEANRQHLIDQALATGNKDMFLELTKN